MEKHDLHHEFPEHEEKIFQLKISNSHFKKLFDEYHQVEKSIHHMEVTEVYNDTEIHKLKSKRLHLKDQLLQIIEAN